MNRCMFTRTNRVITVLLILLCIGSMLNLDNAFAGTTQYCVKYYEVGTENNLLAEKVVVTDDTKIGQVVIERAPEISGFILADEADKTITIGNTEEIIFYYAPDTMTTISPDANELNGVAPAYSFVPTNVWDFTTQPRYNLACESGNYRMYTNYKFTGVTEYKVQVDNLQKMGLVVTAKRALKTYETMSIYSDARITFWVTTEDVDKKFYLQFDVGEDPDVEDSITSGMNIIGYVEAA